jgi:hypothetical protein
LNFGPFDFFTITSQFPLGDYEFNCRMLEPVTGGVKAVDINPFKVQ